MNAKEMQARIAELEGQIAKSKANAGSTARCKVSEKGAVSFYGTGRFPVTLYKSQWEILFANSEKIKTFITDNDAALSTKEKAAEVPAEVAAPAAV
jgi:hypothetical protein